MTPPQTTTKTQYATTNNQPRCMISDLQPGASVNELFVVHDLHYREGGKTGYYVTFLASDRSGSLRGVYWPESTGDATVLLAQVKPGTIARIKGDVVSYRDQTEIRVHAPQGAIEPYTGTKVDLDVFAPSSVVSERELRDAVEVRLGLIGDRHLRRLLRAFFADPARAARYFCWPARATGAHAYVRGLAEEAVETARIVGASAASVPGVNRDLVTAAALLGPSAALYGLEQTGVSFIGSREGCLLPESGLLQTQVTQCAREAGSMPHEVVSSLLHVLSAPDSEHYGAQDTPERAVYRLARQISIQSANAQTNPLVRDA